jgi:hypothetical protein
MKNNKVTKFFKRYQTLRNRISKDCSTIKETGIIILSILLTLILYIPGIFFVYYLIKSDYILLSKIIVVLLFTSYPFIFYYLNLNFIKKFIVALKFINLKLIYIVESTLVSILSLLLTLSIVIGLWKN